MFLTTALHCVFSFIFLFVCTLCTHCRFVIKLYYIRNEDSNCIILVVYMVIVLQFARAKMRKTFVDFDNVNWMVWLRKFLTVLLIYVLKINSLNVNISETVWASDIMDGRTFKDVDICQQMIPLRTLNLMTLTHFFKVNNLKC